MITYYQITFKLNIRKKRINTGGAGELSFGVAEHKEAGIWSAAASRILRSC